MKKTIVSIMAHADDLEETAAVFGAEFYHGTVLENNYTLRNGQRVVPDYRGIKKANTRQPYHPAQSNELDELPEGDVFSVVAGFGKLEPVHPIIEKVEDLLV